MPNLKHLLDDLEEIGVEPDRVRIPHHNTHTWSLLPSWDARLSWVSRLPPDNVQHIPRMTHTPTP